MASLVAAMPAQLPRLTTPTSVSAATPTFALRFDVHQMQSLRQVLSSIKSSLADALERAD